MRYAVARLNKEWRDTAYRIYVTDALYAVTNRGRMLDRFINIIEPSGESGGDDSAADDDRDIDEIVDSIWAGIEGKRKP